MNFFVRLSILLFGLVGFCANADDEPDVQKITVIFEWIETELAELQEMPESADRPAIDHLISENRAEIVKTVVVTGRSGSRSKVIGVKEYTFPTSFDPVSANKTGEAVTKATPRGFEQRDLGASAELDAVWNSKDHTVDLFFAAEYLDLLGKRSYGIDEAECEVPDFYNVEIVAELSLQPGVSTFAGSCRPSAAKGKNAPKNPRWLLFVRADVKFDRELTQTFKPRADSGNRRLRFDFIETDLDRLNRYFLQAGLSTRGPELRRKLIAEIPNKNAIWLDTVFVAGKLQADGQPRRRKTKVTSGQILMYPTDWVSPEVSDDGEKVIPSTPSDFQKIQLGTIINFAMSGSRDELMLAGKIQRDAFIRNNKYLKGPSRMSFPLMHLTKITTDVHLWKNESAFLGTIRPEKAATKGRKRPVIAVFVQVDGR